MGKPPHCLGAPYETLACATQTSGDQRRLGHPRRARAPAWQFPNFFNILSLLFHHTVQLRGRALARRGSPARGGGTRVRARRDLCASMLEMLPPCGPGAQCESSSRATQISGDPRRSGHPRRARALAR